MQARFTRKLLVLCMSLAASLKGVAQDASRVYVEPDGWSIGTNVGMTDLWGDVGTKSVLSHYTNSKYFDKVVFMGGLFGRYTIHPCLDVRMGLNFGTLYATDKWNEDLAKKATTQGDDPVQRYLRSQDAKTYITESYAMFEFMPRRRNPENGKASKRGQPFIGAGLGLFHMDVYSTVANTGKWVNIHNLHLEGQGWTDDAPKNFSLWQPAIPLVLGYRWDLGQHLNLGIEWMYRITFTDYLDGVSGKYIDPNSFAAHLSPADARIAAAVADKQQYYNNELPNNPGNLRGNPSNKDAYSSISITLFYKVLTKQRQWWHY